MRIRILAFDGADEIDISGPYEIFKHAAGLQKDIDVQLVTLPEESSKRSEIVAHHGMRIHTDGVFRNDADLLIVPGGGWLDHSSTGVRHEIERGILPRMIATAYGKGAIVAGVCTGVMALAASGILDKRHATTHHAALEDLRKTAAHVIPSRVVDHGNILTCGGVTSSLDLGLWLVRRFLGEKIATAVADYMEYTPSTDIHVATHANGSNQDSSG